MYGYPPRGAGTGTDSQALYTPLDTDDPNVNLDVTGEDAERGGIPAFNTDDTYGYRTPSLKRRLANLVGRVYFRIFFVLFLFLFAVSLLKRHRQSQDQEIPLWSTRALNFTSTRPAYLSSSLERPLVIRLAIIARVDAFERRQVIREAMLAGINGEDVKIDHRFFVARPKGGKWTVKGMKIRWGLQRERKTYGDVEVIQSFTDVGERISEKRFEAIKWTHSVPHDTYDYSMTIDSDTFCRFSALAKRLAYTHPHLQPREQPIMLGRMGQHHAYYKNTVKDGNKNDTDEDYYFKGPWYQYPIGIGYMLSSNLTKTLMDVDPSVPHHINYPSDDVMIGSWVASLKFFPDPSESFHTTETDPPEDRLLKPTPLLPYIIDTQIIDEKVGWHDVWKEHDNDDAWGKRGIGWDSVCVHQMGIEQMRAFRLMKEVKDEWEDLAL